MFKLSRFGRNAADVLTSLQKLQDSNVNLCCTEDKLDSATGSGKLMITVLSAVAEIERVNIIEQTMAGRKQKARGFAPYGYKLEEGILIIEEAEAQTIRTIYSKFIDTDMGYNGVAKYLNRQSIGKIVRQNGKLDKWSAKLVKDVLDNPVYRGDIAYGRRAKEKKQGTRADYHTVRQDDYILADGIHEGIISIEDWEKAKEKRLSTGVKSPSKVGRDRAHLLAGILRCPECNSPMYTNKNAWTNKDGSYNEHFYYTCSRNRQERGKACSYKASLRKDAIEPDVINAVRALVKESKFADEIRSKIGKQVDTSEIDNELNKYKKSMKQCEKAKETLEQEIDTLSYYNKRLVHTYIFRERYMVDRVVTGKAGKA